MRLHQQEHIARQRQSLARARQKRAASATRGPNVAAEAPHKLDLTAKQHQQVAAILASADCSSPGSAWEDAAVHVGVPREHAEFLRARHALWERQQRENREGMSLDGGLDAQVFTELDSGDEFTVEDIDRLLMSPTQGKRSSRRANASPIDYSKLDHSDKDNVYRSVAKSAGVVAPLGDSATKVDRKPVVETLAFRPLMRGTLSMDENGVAQWTGFWGESEREFESEVGFVSEFKYDGLPQPGTVANHLGMPDYLLSGYFILGDRTGKRAGSKQTERKLLLTFKDNVSSTRMLSVVGHGRTSLAGSSSTARTI